VYVITIFIKYTTIKEGKTQTAFEWRNQPPEQKNKTVYITNYLFNIDGENGIGIS